MPSSFACKKVLDGPERPPASDSEWNRSESRASLSPLLRRCEEQETTGHREAQQKTGLPAWLNSSAAIILLDRSQRCGRGSHRIEVGFFGSSVFGLRSATIRKE